MNNIRKDSYNRKLEINYMFSSLNKEQHAIDKYFLARSTVVFMYGTMEKFVRDTSNLALKIVLDNHYYNRNHVQELMQLVRHQKRADRLFDVLMLHKGIYHNELDHSNDKKYFSRNSKIDSTTIAHIVNVLNLNQFEPMLKIPKLSIDTIANKRMKLAHGDYIKELQRFSLNRQNLTLEEVNDYIEKEFRLNDTTRSDFLTFIDDFSDRILLFIEDIKIMKGTDFKI